MENRVRWTDDEMETLRASLASGMKASEIVINGRPLKLIISKMCKMGMRSVATQANHKGYAIRTCLPCGRKFGSSHIGNRICPACKSTDLYACAV